MLRDAGAPFALSAADMVREGVANVLADVGQRSPDLDAVRPDLPRMRAHILPNGDTVKHATAEAAQHGTA